MEGAYLFLLIIILSGYLFTKNIGINILQCVIVCALFGTFTIMKTSTIL